MAAKGVALAGSIQNTLQAQTTISNSGETEKSGTQLTTGTDARKLMRDEFDQTLNHRKKNWHEGNTGKFAKIIGALSYADLSTWLSGNSLWNVDTMLVCIVPVVQFGKNM